MRTLQTNGCNDPAGCQYALRRGLGFWELTFEGRQTIFKHELGALYVAYLLLNPPPEPLHAVALALKARDRAGQAAGPDEFVEEQSMGLEDAAAVRALWRRQRELERILEDRHEIEPVRAEALRELEEVTEFLRKSPWLSRHGAERCVNAVTVAIKRFHTHLAGAVDAQGRPDAVLQALARHLHEHLLIPSSRGRRGGGRGAASAPAGCFTYEPPCGVAWISGDASSQAPNSEFQRSGFVHPLQCRYGGREAQGSGFEVQGSTVQGSPTQRPAAVEYLSLFLCAGLAVLLLATGCAAPRPLKGGRGVTTRKPAGVIEQTLMQGENPAQPTKQSQETVKVRTYTVPTGSRVEQSQTPGTVASQPDLQLSTFNPQPSTVSPQPSTAFVLSAPMPVIEREETRAGSELGAAQKDTARELGAKLASLKGIVWVGVGLFVFGLASLVYPPLKLVVASVTTSAALMLGGVALMVLPTLIVGNELLILAGVGVAVGAWFLAHRHGQLRGLVAASSGAHSIAAPPATQNGTPRPGAAAVSGTTPATVH
jgi:hypothetical protein